jgi:NAD(P)-dependent dehydrogenase (short-subunit alcohol dehydrogenase family)
MAAVEYGNKSIRVNCIAPTACATPMVAGFIAASPDPAKSQEMITAMNALPGIPQPRRRGERRRVSAQR